MIVFKCLFAAGCHSSNHQKAYTVNDHRQKHDEGKDRKLCYIKMNPLYRAIEKQSCNK